ncbi:MAG: nitronate monooxygenase family protein [Caldisericia bacterium]|nr:nitronate monooxygenase family protein [Caldisericia bacterium]
MIRVVFPKLRIGDLLASVPIIQGGMGVGISLSGLSSAVANQGGIGVIAVAGIGMSEADSLKNYVEANIRALRQEIQKARKLTKGILGVNIMVALSNFSEMVTVAIEEGIDIIFAGAGLPLNLPSLLNTSMKTKLVPIISSARAANLITRRWFERYHYKPDAFVVEGPKAGGHLGFKPDQLTDPAYQLEKLIPEVVQEVTELEKVVESKIPVIAAGGVYTGEDIHKYLSMGASGVQMATRFVATDECDASDVFKQAYIQSKKEDIIIIKSPVGLPGRAIRNSFINDVEAGEKKPFACPYHCIITCDFKKSPYCIASALMHAKRGNLKHGFAFSGSNAYRIKNIVPVKKLMEELREGYEQTNIEEVESSR